MSRRFGTAQYVVNRCQTAVLFGLSMDEPRTPPPLLAPALPAPPDALVLDTWILDPPAPHERPNVLRPEAAALVDGLLT